MKKRLLSVNARQNLTGWMFLTPSFLGVAYFVIFPFADVVLRSFQTSVDREFIGFDNYKSVLNNDAFILAAKNTCRFITVCIPALIIGSLALALMVRTAGKRGGPFKTAYLLPTAIPVASIVLLWKIFFDRGGLCNTMLIEFGAEPIDFMETECAFWILIGSYLWKNAGYDMILWIAGLSGIKNELYESAKVDGANSIQIFRYITLPSLAPTFMIITVLSVINSFKVFREAYLVAGNYPQKSIYLLQHLFNNWFANLDIQRLCAAAVIVALCVLIPILILVKVLGREDM